MASFPATTVKVIGVEPHGDNQVRVIMELFVDVHRMAEVGGTMLRAAMDQVKDDQGSKRKRASQARA